MEETSNKSQESIVPPLSIDAPRPSLLKRIGKSLPVRIFIILSAFAVVVGSVFNTSITQYLLSILMLCVIYRSLPFSKYVKLTVVISVFLLASIMLDKIGNYPYVYPVIGQRVEFNKDVHLITYDDQPHRLVYDSRLAMEEVNPSLGHSKIMFVDEHITNRGIIQKGNTGYVVAVWTEPDGLSQIPVYVISVNGQRIVISSNEMHFGKGYDYDYEAASFCAMVTWDQCSASKSTASYSYPDPMNPRIRSLTNLGYFWIPVFFAGFILEG